MSLIDTTLSAVASLYALLTGDPYRRRHRAKYLVFSSAGDRHNIETWVACSSERNFDLVIYYYGDNDCPAVEADLIVKRKGLKFENFSHFLEHNDIGQYRSIWVVDDDIIMDTSSINQMFRIFHEYD